MDIPKGFTRGPWQTGEMLENVVYAWSLPPHDPDAVICEASNYANAALIALAPDMAAWIEGEAARTAEAVAQARRDALEEAAAAVAPESARPCACDGCTCQNIGDAEDVAAWDAYAWAARTIRALAERPE